jgi:hypothetical protein
MAKVRAASQQTLPLLDGTAASHQAAADPTTNSSMRRVARPATAGPGQLGSMPAAGAIALNLV